jgi:hypothetical protein
MVYYSDFSNFSVGLGDLLGAISIVGRRFLEC